MTRIAIALAVLSSALLFAPLASAGPRSVSIGLPDIEMDDARDALGAVKTFQPSWPPLPAFRDKQSACPAPNQGGPDAAAGASCTPQGFAPFSMPSGSFAPRDLDAAGKGKAAAQPINAGFQALGPAGGAGSVDGPGIQGNGRYWVEASEAFKLSLRIQTGYINGTMTLTREPATGKDRILFSGWLWDQKAGKWGPKVETSAEVQLSYNQGNDEGSLRWQEGGAWKSERFWGGKAGGRSMVIELGGGWDHTFKRD